MDRVKKSVLTIAVISLAVHLVVTALVSHTFDSEYWLIIMQNIENGNGLYGLNGYYYTPVWGYILSFGDALIHALNAFPFFGDRFTDLVMIEQYWGYQATLAEPGLNFMIKLPLSLCDVAVGYLIFKFVYRFTSDDRKALLAMALWSFCPIVIYMSAVQGQFDSMGIMIFLLCIIAVRYGKPLSAGILFALTVWLKIFPGICILPLAAYVWALHKDQGDAVKSIAMAALGAGLTTLILFLPVIMEGDMEYAFSFLLSRVSEYSILPTLWMLTFVSVAVIGMVVAAKNIASKEGMDAERTLILYSGVLIVAAAMAHPGYQYASSIVAFPLMFAMISDNRRTHLRMFGLISLGTFLEAMLWLNMSGFFIVSSYFGMFDPAWLYESTEWFILNIGSEAPVYSYLAVNIVWRSAVSYFILRGLYDLSKENDGRYYRRIRAYLDRRASSS